MDHPRRTVVSSHRHRQRRRATITLTLVGLVLVGTFTYAAAYFQGWITTGVPHLTGNSDCQVAAPAPAPALTPRAVTINVYNATSRNGLAASVAKSLRIQGFKIAAVANDPLGQQIARVGEVRHGRLGAAGATLVAVRLPGVKIVLDERTDSTVDLVLGDRFSALHTPPKVVPSKATKPTPAPKQSC